MGGNMSDAGHAGDASDVHLQKLGRGLRADWPLSELRRFPLLFNRGGDLSCHLHTRENGFV